MRNGLVLGCLWLAAVTATAGAQEVGVSPQVRTKTTADSKITEIELEAHFVTTIRLPEPVNSLVVGDPALFQVEHSEQEPALVFVKALTNEHARATCLSLPPRVARSAFSLSAVAEARMRPRLIFFFDTSNPEGFWSSLMPYPSRW